MTSMFSFSFLFFLLCFFTFSLSPTVGGRVDTIVKVLSDAGYEAMSLTLELTLTTLIPPESSNNSTITIFCPPDQAFLSLKYPQPPLTLLKYHVAPVKLEREALEQSSPPLGTKIDTLLPGHPLVVTTLPYDGYASINDVKIKQWDIYNDGRVIVHGVENFFDPAFQTILYPWYDAGVMMNSDNISKSDVRCTSIENGDFTTVKDTFVRMMIYMLFAALSIFMLARCCFLIVDPIEIMISRAWFDV